MTHLRPLLGMLALAALLTARAVPDVTGELVLSATDSIAALYPHTLAAKVGSPCFGLRP